MEHRKVAQQKQQPITQAKSSQALLALIDKNELIFLKMKKDLEEQLRAYERAFSRQHNQYIELRDFDHFSSECEKFQQKGKDFVEKILEIRNNCTTVIKNLPQEERLMPVESHNSFDMFANEQVEKSLDYRVKSVEYQHDAQRPFENMLEEFQIE